MYSIKIENLSKCYKTSIKKRGLEGIDKILSILNFGKWKNSSTRELWALKEVSFSVEQGEVLGIIGGNGAGKSTLLKILARITLPTSGRALLRGRVVALMEMGAGFDPFLTAKENIYMNAAFYGISKEEVSKNLDEIMAFAELEDFVDTPVRRFSSGMYVRLAFSNAIHMRPDILLADEVLAVGDIKFQSRCMSKMKEISQSGITVLLVSHDMEAIKRMCDRCICIDRGSIIDSGLPKEVVEQYQQRNLVEPELVKRKGKKQGILAGELGKLLSVQLISDTGHELAAVRVSQEANLCVRIKVNAPESQLFLNFDVKLKGIMAFRTIADMKCAESGIYEAFVCIPKHLLAEAEYTVSAGVRITSGDRETSLMWYNALMIKVYDVGDELSARGSFTGRMPGVVCPKLKWQMVQKKKYKGKA